MSQAESKPYTLSEHEWSDVKRVIARSLPMADADEMADMIDDTIRHGFRSGPAVRLPGDEEETT